ncbi:hypothetical protein ACH42_07295 [Endozoicomonas sp. (ex Bugula neritina AB1)]|nr:hypothetical protein ACH42_07295 [Endozoicomonas sp. (ex Bugula neritina AB1)]
MSKPYGIQVRDLNKYHQGHAVLSIAQFDAGHGEAICLKGSNGSGKSTLLHTLSGATANCSGEVSVLGRNIISTPQSVVAKLRAEYIGFIFQHYRLIPYLSAFDNIMLPCFFSDLRQQEACARMGSNNTLKNASEDAFRLIRQLKLQDPSRLSKAASAYSAGQQQRFAIVRALIGSPSLILADEPASAMDSSGKQAVYDLLLKECRETGATLLCATHDDIDTSAFDRTINMDELNTAKEKEIRWLL